MAAHSATFIRFRHAVIYGLLSFILVICGSTQTLAEGHEDDEVIGEIDVITTGTRHRARSEYDTIAPVDVIRADELATQSSSDLVDIVRTSVPSFNVNTQPISDASTLVRPANIRGLPADHTLVLVNGKRRHRASVIHWNSGNGASEGAQGPDIAAIPVIALKRMEILRDSASAQYGSDAIAGVMNFILKDDASGGSLEAKYGRYSEDSGESAYTIAGNIGLPFTSQGFFNASFEYSEADDTDRSSPRADALHLIDEGNMHVVPEPQIWGSPEINDDFKSFFNLGLELDDSKEFYMFGNYAFKEVDGGFYFRNPGRFGPGRVGVFVDGSGINHLIGDLDPTDTIDCTGLGNNVADHGGGLITPLPAGCFSHNERFPGGFTPRFGADMEDISLVAGLSGELNNGLSYDFSASFGYNDADFFIYNTINSSLGPDDPGLQYSFDPGDYTQTEYSLNADFNYPVEVEGFASDLNVAGGWEYRIEEFEITAGEKVSWEEGILATQGFTAGTNGFPGFSPDIAGDWERDNYALYLDLEADVTERWLVGAAVRYEDFEDFGSTTNTKLGTHFDITDTLGLRASWGTGFRAPTPGQVNASNISTNCNDHDNDPNTACVLQNVGTIASSNAAAKAVGGEELEEEESTSWTVGLAFERQNWSITVDYFNVEVDDRIALSAEHGATQEDRDRLAAAGITGAGSLSTFRFFTNDFDTKTTGYDVVISHSKQWNAGVTDFTLVYNDTETEVEDFTEGGTLTEARIKEIEENLPERRMNVTASHKMGDWRFLLRYNWVDEWYDAEDSETYDDYWTMDAEVAYTLNNGLTVVAGGTNFTDETPDSSANEDLLGLKHSQFAPLGFNGAFYYGRLVYKF